jgi:hypothetical protein
MIAKHQEREIWRSIGGLFVLLGINKQLDLQTAFTELGRLAAYYGGWYEHRQIVQIAFIMLIAATCGTITLVMILRSKQTSAACRLAIFGTAIVLCFVLVRAASFHHVDMFINQTVLFLRWNWILEMGGIAIVIVGSLIRLRWKELPNQRNLVGTV